MDTGQELHVRHQSNLQSVRPLISRDLVSHAAGVARPQRDRQQLGRVVAPQAERMEPVATLERGPGLLLLRMGGHQRGVHVEHDHLAQIGASDPRRRQSRQQSPEVPTACARAFSTRVSAAGVASSRVCHTVGAETTGPNRPG